MNTSNTPSPETSIVSSIYHSGKLYDLLFPAGTEGVRYWSTLAQTVGDPILEIMCGTGLISIPVVFNNPTHENLTRALDALDAHTAQKCFVHCIANYRVSAFIFLDRVLRLGVPQAEATVQLEQIWQPNDIWAEFITRELATQQA